MVAKFVIFLVFFLVIAGIVFCGAVVCFDPRGIRGSAIFILRASICVIVF